MNEEDIKVVLAQIGSALLWMHNRGYAHMDVKPENILILSVKPWQLKLSDFGSYEKCKQTGETILGRWPQ